MHIVTLGYSIIKTNTGINGPTDGQNFYRVASPRLKNRKLISFRFTPPEELRAKMPKEILRDKRTKRFEFLRDEYGAEKPKRKSAVREGGVREGRVREKEVDGGGDGVNQTGV